MLNNIFFLNCFYLKNNFYNGFIVLSIKNYDSIYLTSIKKFLKKKNIVFFFLKRKIFLKNFFKFNIDITKLGFYLFCFDIFYFLNIYKIFINLNFLIKFFFLNNYLFFDFLKNQKIFEDKLNLLKFFNILLKYFYFLFFFLKIVFILKFVF